jgi:endonuclease YncB( thermonuclease family)
MPLSFRRSYKKRPGVDLDKNKRRVEKDIVAKAVRPSEEFRPTKYPLVIPIGCGVAIGLCLFVVFSRGLVRLPWLAGAAPAADWGFATAAFETALAEQLGTLEAQRPTQAPATRAASTATPSTTATVGRTPTLPPVVAPPDNPLVTAIPEAWCIQPDLPQTGRVVEVVDGDTIKVLLDSDGRVYSVRYLGADAPDLSDSTGIALQVMARNTELVYRKQAVLVRDVTDSDLNGTLLRYVLADGVFVNHRLVAEGWAKTSMSPPDTACLGTLLSAEQQAQAAGLGLWGIQPAATTSQ